MSLVYDCGRCGLCCSKLIIEAEPSDVIREPKIAYCGRLLDGKGDVPPADWMWLLHPIDDALNPCPFLSSRKRCRIYRTRPETCVAFLAGCRQCRDLRAQHGLPPLVGREPIGAVEIAIADALEDE